MKITVDLTDERNRVKAGESKSEVLKDILVSYIFGEIPEPEFITDTLFLPCTLEEIQKAFRMIGFQPSLPNRSLYIDKNGDFDDEWAFDEDSPQADDEMYGCTSELMMTIKGNIKTNAFRIQFSNGCVRPEHEY